MMIDVLSTRMGRVVQHANDHSSSSFCSSDDLHVLSTASFGSESAEPLHVACLYSPRSQFIPALTNRLQLRELLACFPEHGQLNEPSQEIDDLNLAKKEACRLERPKSARTKGQEPLTKRFNKKKRHPDSKSLKQKDKHLKHKKIKRIEMSYEVFLFLFA